MKKKVKLDLEVLELESKIAPTECYGCGHESLGNLTQMQSGAEC